MDITGDDAFSTEITFSSRILQDYSESVGNRVVSIDDFSGIFNSNPRATRFSTVARWTLADRRAVKYFTYVRDKRFSGQRQLMIVDIINDNSSKTIGVVDPSEATVKGVFILVVHQFFPDTCTSLIYRSITLLK